MRRIALVLVLLALPLSATRAAADPINITGGSLDMRPSFGPLLLIGDRGFTFSSAVDASGGIFLPFTGCNFDPAHCMPGQTIDLRAGWSGNDLTGTATLDGVTYANVGSLSSTSSLAVRFLGTAALPPLTADAVTITAPFLFDGTFIHPSTMGVDAIHDALEGHGFATLTLMPNAGFPGAWSVEHALYEFGDAASPTPEPADLLLLGSGLIGLAALLRVRRGTPTAR